ncbi:hypothetical protein COB72_07350 [bacterium]|nr:MAG: hypothetical protein COB72_07350 [bacterium]
MVDGKIAFGFGRRRRHAGDFVSGMAPGTSPGGPGEVKDGDRQSGAVVKNPQDFLTTNGWREILSEHG